MPRLGGQNTGHGYGCPGADVPRRVDVGSVFVAARNTGEGGLVRSVLLVDAAALRALARGVAWIDEHDWNAGPPRLVGGEGAKLAEAPVGQTGSTGAAGRYPAADAFEFFKGETAAGALRFLYESLGHHMVLVVLIPRLLAHQLAQPTLGGLGAACLEAVPALLMATLALDLGARVSPAVAVSGDVDDAKVHADPVGGLECLGLGDVAGRRQDPLAAHPAQIDLALAEGY